MEELTSTELNSIMIYNCSPGSHTFHMCPECNKNGCRRYKCNRCVQKELDDIQEKAD